MANTHYVILDCRAEADLTMVPALVERYVSEAGYTDHVDVRTLDGAVVFVESAYGLVEIRPDEWSEDRGSGPRLPALSFELRRGGEWGFWLMTHVMHRLAEDLDGRLASDAIPGVRDPDISRWPTYSDWLEQAVPDDPSRSDHDREALRAILRAKPAPPTPGSGDPPSRPWGANR